MSKDHFSKKGKEIQTVFFSILHAYQEITDTFLSKKIFPYADKRDAISSAVQSSNKVDVNLKLFDVMGRLALAGVWKYWFSQQLIDNGEEEKAQEVKREANIVAQSVKSLINNNKTLLLPCKDDHVIEISLVLLLFSYVDDGADNYSKPWLQQMINRASFAYRCNGPYPSILRSYRSLLEHPKYSDEEYKRQVTISSVLYPMIAMWAALLKDNNLFETVKTLQSKELPHCSFQLWYPDESTEAHLYINNKTHGASVCDINVSEAQEDFLNFIKNECDQIKGFSDLTANTYGVWPLILVACRHYRIPVPPDFFDI